VVPGDKGALSRLLRAPDEFLGEELLQRRVEFCLGIGFPIGRHEKSRVILLAGKAAEHILSVMEEKMPLSLAGKLGLPTLLDEFDKIRIIGRHTSIDLQGWNETQHEQ
jgi:hypothetical protein